jgi:hypothetical protein
MSAFTIDHLLAFLGKCKNLKSLVLYDVDAEEEDTREIFEVLIENCPNLEYIYSESEEISVACFVNFVTKCKSLQGYEFVNAAQCTEASMGLYYHIAREIPQLDWDWDGEKNTHVVLYDFDDYDESLVKLCVRPPEDNGLLDPSILAKYEEMYRKERRRYLSGYYDSEDEEDKIEVEYVARVDRYRGRRRDEITRGGFFFMRRESFGT